MTALALAPLSSASAGSIQGTIRGAARSDAWVYIDDPRGPPAPAAHAVIDQRGLRFVPKSSLVVKGTTIDFTSNDTDVHDVYQLGGLVDEVGEIELGCRIHEEMSGYVLVVPSGWYARVDPKTGRYRIDGLPDGEDVEPVVWTAGRRAWSATVPVGGRPVDYPP